MFDGGGARRQEKRGMQTPTLRTLLTSLQERRKLLIRETNLVETPSNHNDDANLLVVSSTGECLALRAQSTSELVVEDSSETAEVNVGDILKYMKRKSITEEELNLASEVLGFACGETTRREATLELRFQDAGCTLSAIELLDFATGDTAHIVWNSTLLLLNYLMTNKRVCDEYVRNRAIVEIGAGNGVLGIACVVSPLIGAKHAICTDYNEFCLRVIERNAVSMRCDGSGRTAADSVKSIPFDWTTKECDDRAKLFNVEEDATLIGSAVVYEPFHAIHVAETVDEFLRHGGESRKALICIHEEHYGFNEFVENVIKMGMVIEVLRISRKKNSSSRVVLLSLRRR